MKKFTVVLLTLLFSIALFASCAPADHTQVRAAFLKGPTGVGAAKLMSDADEQYVFTLTGTNDDITAGLLSGNLDIAAVATNLAAVLAKRTDGNIRILAVNTLGVLHILSKNGVIASFADLRGKTLVTSGAGAVPEYVLNYLLKANGLEPGTDVTVEYRSEHAEVASLAIAGNADVVLLPEPFATNLVSKDASYAYSLDLSAEYRRITGKDMAMGCLVARADWADAHPQVVKKFMSDYAASTSYAVSHTAETADLCASLGIIPSAAVAVKAIPKCNIVCLTGNEMKTALSDFYKVLFDSNPASVGGSLPADGIYG